METELQKNKEQQAAAEQAAKSEANRLEAERQKLEKVAVRLDAEKEAVKLDADRLKAESLKIEEREQLMVAVIDEEKTNLERGSRPSINQSTPRPSQMRIAQRIHDLSLCVDDKEKEIARLNAERKRDDEKARMQRSNAQHLRKEWKEMEQRLAAMVAEIERMEMELQQSKERERQDELEAGASISTTKLRAFVDAAAAEDVKEVASRIKELKILKPRKSKHTKTAAPQSKKINQ